MTFLKLFLLISVFRQGQSDVNDVLQKGYMTLADFQVPRCEYESCYNSSQCSLVTAMKNPNFTQETNAIFTCSCDQHCLLYGDCCYDYFQVCLNKDIYNVAAEFQAWDLSPSKTLDRMEAHHQMLLHKECLEFTDGNDYKMYWFVKRCPRTGNLSSNDIKMCESNPATPLGKIPVTLKANPTITFWNVHCAHCHGTRRSEVRFWKTNASCDHLKLRSVSFDNIQQLIQQGKCRMEIRKNSNDKPRICTDRFSTKRTMPVTNSTLFSPRPYYHHKSEVLCPLYMYPVKDPGDNIYSNVHCAYLINGPISNYFPFRCAWRFEDKLLPKHSGGPCKGQQVGLTEYTTAAFYQGMATGVAFGTAQTSMPMMAANVAPTAAPSRPGSLRIMFNFDSAEMTFSVNNQIVKTVTKFCEMVDEVFVPYNERCVKLHCEGRDRRPINGTCQLREKVVVNGTGQLFPDGATMLAVSLQILGKKSALRKVAEQQIKLYLKTLFNNVYSDPNDGIQKVVVKRFTKYFVKDTFSRNHDRIRNGVYGYNIAIHSEAPVSSLVHQVFNTHGVLVDNMTRFNLTVLKMSVKNFKVLNSRVNYTIYDYYNEMSSTNISICPNDTIPELFKNVSLTMDKKVIYAKINVTEYILDNIVFHLTVEDKIAPSNMTDIIVCLPAPDNDTFHCPDGYVSIDSSKFDLGNGILTLKYNKVKLPPEKFRVTDEGASICSTYSPVYQTNVVFFNYNTIQDILTIVTSSVSMSSLSVVLIVYYQLPDLRNIPGKIVMSLSATLFLAQGLQLLITVPTGCLCTAVAALVHVTWLSSFMWMTVLSVDLARSLRSMSPVAGVQSHNRLLCLYAGLAWGLPVLFVAACYLLDHFHIWGIVIGYGSDHLCWLSNPKASLYIFGLPVAITLIINAVCFILSLVQIEKTTSKIATKSKSCKNETIRLGIYVKLTLIMGFSWSFCFAAAFAKIELLWYFQIVLNGLQGFYVCVCFVFKSRVKKLLMDKLHLHIKKTLSKATITTSTDKSNI